MMTGGNSHFKVFDDEGEGRVRIGELWPAGLLAIAALIFLLIGSMGGGTTDQWVVIAAPWASRAEMTELVWHAQGGVAAYGGVAPLLVAMSDAPDFKRQLYRQGAWLVFPSPRFLGCSSKPMESKDEK